MQFPISKLYPYIDMKNFKCFYCDSDLIWQNDFDEGSEQISHFYCCPNCGTEYVVTEPPENEKETATE